MFLNTVCKQNPKLIRAAFSLHQQGLLMPDTYVLDFDQIYKNGKQLYQAASLYGAELYYMSKQFGRNPLLIAAMQEIGFSGAVCVDYKEGLQLMKMGVPIAHLGHLVQIPKHLLKTFMEYGVSYITIYSIDKLKEIEAIAEILKIKQKIMVKVMEPDCHMYDGQISGFHIDELRGLSEAAKLLPAIELCGVTSFPCMLYDPVLKKTIKTKNFDVVLQAKEVLEQLGCKIDNINLPSCNNLNSLPLLEGIKHLSLEPGHALTGTTPYNEDNLDEEVSAMVYVSEVSHRYEQFSYCYGGGHYRRSHMKNALVGNSLEQSTRVHISAPADENIDYYFCLNEPCEISQCVVAAFRTQIFTTRSHIAIVKGIAEDNPQILGVFDALGNPL